MLPPEIRRLFKHLLPIYGQQKLDPLKLEYQLNPKSRPEIELILECLAQQAFGDQQTISPPPKGRVKGTYQLGDVAVGSQPWDRFGLREDEWIQHVGIFGRTGSGKTTSAF